MHQPYDQVIPFLTQEKWNIYPYKGLYMNIHSSLFSVHARSLQSCLALWDFIDCSLPYSAVHRILKARTMEWDDMPSSRGSSWLSHWTQVSLSLLLWQANSLPLAPPGKFLFCVLLQWILHLNMCSLLYTTLLNNAIWFFFFLIKLLKVQKHEGIFYNSKINALILFFYAK